MTRFGYVGAGRLTQITYPAHSSNAFVTNSYDAIGQANANGSATTFYFAGARTETADPAGDRHVTY